MARLHWSKWPLFRFSPAGIREDVLPVGSFSKDDRDGNENVTIKRNRFSKQSNNLARVARFFVHFFAVTTRVWREIPCAMFYGGSRHTTTFLPSFWA